MTESLITAEPKTLAEADISRSEARRKLWKLGHLEWKFEGGPWAKEMYDFTRANWGRSPYLVWGVHRRGWKSTTGIIIALEECLREPNTRCAIICKTKDQAQEICDVSMVEVLADCPAALRPRKIKNDYAYQFDHNGSFFRILALDGKQSLKARGRKFKFILITEFGFIERIDKILKSSVLPTLRDVLGQVTGMLVLESTPPEEPGHPMQQMVDEAEVDGRLFWLPLSKNKWAHPDFVEAAKRDSGGENSVDFLREYELKFIFDDESRAIPEFTQERAFQGDPKHELPPVVRELAYPEESDHYGSLDPGGSDLSGLLWATYLFEQDLVYVEDELAIVNMTTDDLAARVVKREKALWGESPQGRVRRYADNSNKQILYDLFVKHQLNYAATAKDNKDAQINALRVMIREGRLAIHPRCKLLIKTLRIAKRAKQANRGFERMEDIGHADLLDALLYLVRNVRRREVPKAPAQRQAEVQVRAPPTPPTQAHRQLARALGLNRFRR